ncbi:MAG: hypothetical protein H6Q01_208, partial [Acidobacteria bacterium]|nr:hypothetical protein [Acidobacteriota bacterium]
MATQPARPLADPHEMIRLEEVRKIY